MSTYAQRQRETRDAEIVKLAKLGYTNQRIGWRMGLSADTVSRIRRKHDLGTPRRQVTPDQLAQAEQLAADGVAHKEIERTLGWSHGTFRNHFPDVPAWTAEERTAYENDAGLRTDDALRRRFREHPAR